MATSAPTAGLRTRRRVLGAIALIAIAVGATSWSQPHVDGSDLWWHLATGRYISEHGAIPRVDPFSHTAKDRAWTDHSWLWGWLFWTAYDGHADRAAWLNLALIALLFCLIAWHARRVSGSWLAAGAASWLVAACCHWFFDVRPHIVTLLFSALLLATLHWRRAAWLWPPLLALWSNLHAGFAFGLGLIALFALLQSEEALRDRQPFPRAAWLGVLGAALAACLNPWGFAIYAVPFQHIYHGSPFGELVEWQATAASLDPASYAGRFWWLVVFTVIGVWRGRAAPFSIALAAVTAAMAIVARRFIPLFAVSAAPLVALGVGALLEPARRRLAIASKPWTEAVACGAALLGALLLWHDVRLLPRPLQRWTSGESYPSGAAAYLAALPDPPKHLFNFYNWGGYLILRIPGIPVFIDSRASTLYDAQLAADYFGMLDAEGSWREKLARYGVDAVLVPTQSRIAGALHQARPAWQLVYIDPRSALFLRRDRSVQSELAPAARALPVADLELSRGYRLRERGDLEGADAALRAALRADPLQLFAYGELMFVASLRGDAEGVRSWIEEALRAYPRRWNPIWSFAEQAWEAMGRCQESHDALRRIRLGGPFVADELRAEIREQIRDSRCRPLR